MRMRFGNASSNLLAWIPGLALSLFFLLGLAAYLGWIPTSIGLGDRPAVGSSRASAHELTRPAVRVAQAVSTGLPAVLCSKCGGGELARLVARTGEPDGAGAFWLGSARVTKADAPAWRNDRLDALIAWHVCARTGSGCD